MIWPGADPGNPRLRREAFSSYRKSSIGQPPLEQSSLRFQLRSDCSLWTYKGIAPIRKAILQYFPTRTPGPRRRDSARSDFLKRSPLVYALKRPKNRCQNGATSITSTIIGFVFEIDVFSPAPSPGFFIPRSRNRLCSVKKVFCSAFRAPRSAFNSNPNRRFYLLRRFPQK